MPRSVAVFIAFVCVAFCVGARAATQEVARAENALRVLKEIM